MCCSHSLLYPLLAPFSAADRSDQKCVDFTVLGRKDVYFNCPDLKPIFRLK